MTVGINRTKASSHPTREDGIYLGVVKRVLPDGKAFVYIPKLSNTIGPMRVANIVGNSSLEDNSTVLCAHVGGGTEEMYVIGHITKLVLNYTTTSDVSSLISSALMNYVTTTSLSATLSASLSNYATTASLSNYATTASLSDYATVSESRDTQLLSFMDVS